MAKAKLMTVTQAAKFFKVSEVTIRRWANEGRIEKFQPSGKKGAMRIVWRENSSTRKKSPTKIG